jgi:hypothetical protein
MTKHKIFGGLTVCAAALAITASPARAQDPVTTAAATAVVAPIVEKAIGVVSAKPPNPKGNWLKAEVIHADSNSIIVREEANGMMIHTFTYSPEVHDEMQRIQDRGGYQYGDKVKIRFVQGETVALKVHGKPSKPL